MYLSRSQDSVTSAEPRSSQTICQPAARPHPARRSIGLRLLPAIVTSALLWTIIIGVVLWVVR